MSDPAVAAADRVMEADWEESPDVWVTVAREALAPIRELHPRENVGCGDTEEWLCPECMVTWPCNTAKIIYTTEEGGAVMSDLDAIREDVALAARSAEMARHVALDHTPELLYEVERLRATVEQVQELADTYGFTPNMTSVHHEIADQIARVLDGAPDRRRVETAEDLDALPDRTVIRDADEWVFEKLNYSNDGTGESFWAAPAIDPDSDDYNIGPDLPATVLWLPEVSS